MAWLKSHRSAAMGIVLVVLFVVVYVLSMLMYSRSGQSTIAHRPPAQKNGIQAQLDVVNVDPLRHEITVRVALLPEGTFADGNGGFKNAMQVKYYFNIGEQSIVTIDIPKGELYSLNEMKFLTFGNYDTYPLDVYRPEDADDSADPMKIPIFELNLLDSEGKVVSGEDAGEIPIWVEEEIGSPHGWTAKWSLNSGDSILWWDYSLKRSGGVLIFVGVVLVMMAALAIAALSVSIRVFRKPGVIEATMASWQAALLFALIPLRNFLPGAPPIGAWIDALVFYWVILALMVSMALFTYTWLRDKGHLPGEKKPKVP